MESFEDIFSKLSESVTSNIIPIAIVLLLVLLVIGWLMYKSFNTSPKNEKIEEEYEPEQDAKSETEQFTDEKETE